ncbi:MAG: tyrosine-protein phosphatase [Planctomycetes bacterium]|nr:tyrosine-protein phosphatase [Planctomycetota bacterium]
MKSRQRTQRIALALLLLGVAVWSWEEVLEDRLIPKNWGCVEPGLIYRSGQLSAALVERTLKKHNIEVVVTLNGEKPQDADCLEEREACRTLGIDLKRFPLGGDGTGDIHHYANAIAAIVAAVKAQRPVLVHCAAGAQRTGGVLACYRLLVKGDPNDRVLQELSHYGWRPEKNPKLLPFVNGHMAELAALLKEKRVLAEVPDPLPVL